MNVTLASKRVYDWLDARLALTPYKAMAEQKTVPMHRHAFWYYLGGIVLMFLLVQVATGALLMVYYVPEIGSAHNSILTINSRVDFGWFIRSLHTWGANLMILALFFHMFSTYLMKAYRPPREITWWSGLVLMGVSFGFGFTGYLLPWDQMAYFATKIGLDIAAAVPLAGDAIADLLRGGPTISQATLSRFFTLHVMVLPLMLLPILGIHLLLVQIHGMSKPEGLQNIPKNSRTEEPFFPTFLLKDLMGWMAVLNLLAILVALFPWGIGAEAQPFKPAPAGIKPEWYFLFLFQFFKVLPGHIGPMEGEQFGMVLFALVLVSLVAIPFWDRGDSPRKSQWATYYGIGLIGAFIVLTVWGYVS